jgi:hypothetical protein
VFFFLWLVSKNKVLIHDNLEKRRVVEDTSCLFYSEKESVHLLFECVVAKSAWEVVNEATGCRVGADYESIEKLWLYNKKFGNVNMVIAAVCWSVWKLRNTTHGGVWVNKEMLWWRVLTMLRCWRVLVRMVGFDAILAFLERLVVAPEQIPWTLTIGNGAWPDGANITAPSPGAVQFDPP